MTQDEDDSDTFHGSYTVGGAERHNALITFTITGKLTSGNDFSLSQNDLTGTSVVIATAVPKVDGIKNLGGALVVVFTQEVQLGDGASITIGGTAYDKSVMGHRKDSIMLTASMTGAVNVSVTDIANELGIAVAADQGSFTIASEVEYRVTAIAIEMPEMGTQLHITPPDTGKAVEVDFSSLSASGSDTASIPNSSGVTIDIDTVNVTLPGGTEMSGFGTAPDTQRHLQFEKFESYTVPAGTVAGPGLSDAATLAAIRAQVPETVFSAGRDDKDISFVYPVRILFEGDGRAERVFYFSDTNDDTIPEVNTIVACATTDRETAPLLAADGDCFFRDGDDLYIWTRHFTVFGVSQQELDDRVSPNIISAAQLTSTTTEIRFNERVQFVDDSASASLKSAHWTVTANGGTDLAVTTVVRDVSDFRKLTLTHAAVPLSLASLAVSYNTMPADDGRITDMAATPNHLSSTQPAIAVPLVLEIYGVCNSSLLAAGLCDADEVSDTGHISVNGSMTDGITAASSVHLAICAPTGSVLSYSVFREGVSGSSSSATIVADNDASGSCKGTNKLIKKSFTPSAEGVYRAEVRLTSGGRSESDTYMFVSDRTAPTVTAHKTVVNTVNHIRFQARDESHGLDGAGVHSVRLGFFSTGNVALSLCTDNDANTQPTESQFSTVYGAGETDLPGRRFLRSVATQSDYACIRAYDTAGNRVDMSPGLFSSLTAINPDSPSPTISGPADGTVFTGGSVTFTGCATGGADGTDAAVLLYEGPVTFQSVPFAHAVADTVDSVNCPGTNKKKFSITHAFSTAGVKDVRAVADSDGDDTLYNASTPTTVSVTTGGTAPIVLSARTISATQTEVTMNRGVQFAATAPGFSTTAAAVRSRRSAHWTVTDSGTDKVVSAVNLHADNIDTIVLTHAPLTSIASTPTVQYRTGVNDDGRLTDRDSSPQHVHGTLHPHITAADGIAPSFSVLDIIGTTENARPSLMFTPHETVTIAMRGLCETTVNTAFGGVVTIITLTGVGGADLAPGTYTDCDIIAIDTAGNEGVYSVMDFTVVTGTNIDYDTDNDNLIEIRTLAQLNAVRWDLDGNGSPQALRATDYAAAFPSALSGMGCMTTCIGYELDANLDFDTNRNGTADSADAYYNNAWGGIR